MMAILSFIERYKNTNGPHYAVIPKLTMSTNSIGGKLNG